MAKCSCQHFTPELDLCSKGCWCPQLLPFSPPKVQLSLWSATGEYTETFYLSVNNTFQLFCHKTSPERSEAQSGNSQV